MLFKSSPPILLPLAANSCKPMAEGDLLEQTQKDGKPDDLKSPIIEMRSQGVDRSTVRTAISPQTQCSGTLIEIPPYIAMAPESPASTPRTARGTRPWIVLSDLLKELDIEFAVQYQDRSRSGITEGSSPGRESPWLSLLFLPSLL